MEYEAIIFDVNFLPLVDVVESTLSIRAVIPSTNEIIRIEDFGSITALSEKYEFIIVSNSEWDLRRMHKRDCIVNFDGNRYSFVRYQ